MSITLNEIRNMLEKSEDSIIYRLASYDRNAMINIANMLENNVNVSHIVFNAA